MMKMAEMKRVMPIPAAVMQFWLAEKHDDRADQVENALRLVCKDMQRNRKYHQSRDEDILTVHITSALKTSGLLASHDADSSGHPDIVVDGDDGFLWLGEAKVHRGGYRWLAKGWNQLTTRYSHGGDGNRRGAIVIYCYNQKSSFVLSTWATRLTKWFTGVTNISAAAKPIPDKSQEFVTEHLHSVSGLKFTALHYIVPLHYAPED